MDVKVEEEEDDDDSLDLERSSPAMYGEEEDDYDEYGWNAISSESSEEEDLVPFSLRSDLTPDMKKWQLKIRYSDRYRTTDAEYRYVLHALFECNLEFNTTYIHRHVILPKTFYESMVCSSFKERLLSEPEWRHIGIVQSLGWEHYLIHDPEPHIFLFRRALEDEKTKKKIKTKQGSKKEPIITRQALKETQVNVSKRTTRQSLSIKKENDVDDAKKEEENPIEDNDRCIKRRRGPSISIELARRRVIREEEASSTTVTTSDQVDGQKRRRSQRLSSISATTSSSRQRI